MTGFIFTHQQPYFFTIIIPGGMVINRDALQQAHRLLKPLMLRRLKSDIEMKLPPRTETNIMCPLSKMQRFWYKRLLLKESDLLDATQALEKTGAFAAGAAGLKRMRSLLMQLRKCCNHPYLFNGAEAAMNQAHAEGRSKHYFGKYISV
jgi:SWI/SNF-related matrix-associated actin-dependent regulator of chromatin subfamily A member 5